MGRVICASFLLSISVSLNMCPLCVIGHAIFKFTYLSNHDYKPLYFESDAATVNEIVLKVSYGWLSVLCSFFNSLELVIRILIFYDSESIHK